MTESRKTGAKRPAKAHRPAQGRVQASVHAEVNQIIRRAKDNDERIVSLGPLVLFSTSTGDAWMLDGEDGLALCLARNGQAQPFKITESPSDFGVEWTARYRIEGDRFVVAEPSQQVQTFQGYPTSEILRLTPKWA